jgi:gliding motility-associated-like protein
LIKVLNGAQEVWDGTNNKGLKVMATDYWFKAIFKDGSIKTGHLSLIY